MTKLYWIVCEENDQTLHEGRFLGRTRGAALKHLKEHIGRSNLTGLVFSITEIPVPLIREIVAEILSERAGEDRPPDPSQTESDQVFRHAPAPESEADPEATPPPPSGATTRLRTDYDWVAIKACYMEGRSPKDVAAKMNVPINTLRKRITREGWAKERSAQ